MPKKRQAFLHIGLDDGSGDLVGPALVRHHSPLLELGVRHPAESGEESFHAALELLRDHKTWGYKRKEVEGTWHRMLKRAAKGRDTVVVSQPLLAAARPEQVALTVDALHGFEVHVVVTVQAPDAWTVPGDPARDLGSVLDRWSLGVRDPQRLHVLVSDGDPARTWKRLGKTAGFGTASLRLDDLPAPVKPRPPHQALPERAAVLEALGRSWVELLATSPYDVVGDTALLLPTLDAVEDPEKVVTATEHALNDALVELERLTRRNESLELRVEKLEKKKRKLKRRLSEVDVA